MSRVIRVASISAPRKARIGGVWTYALELIDALAPHDIEVTLAILGPAPDPSCGRDGNGVAD
ncbi:MAG: hypothetical protein JWM12_3562 [Ilumatobacteraceae bacterium]|nr:hypothetical protein [Ilumatobacteraceae bacterium]